MDDDVKREYELAIIADSEIAEKDIERFLSDKSFDTEIIGRETVEMVQLAYPIKKHSSAALFVYYLKTLPENAVKIKNGLAFQANVLRFLLVTPPVKRSDNRKRPDSSESKKIGSEISSTEELAKTLEQLQ